MSAMKKPPILPVYHILNNEKLLVTGVLPQPMTGIREGEVATVIWSVFMNEENVYTVLSLRPEVSPGNLVSERGLDAVRVKIVDSTDKDMMYGTKIITEVRK